MSKRLIISVIAVILVLGGAAAVLFASRSNEPDGASGTMQTDGNNTDTAMPENMDMPAPGPQPGTSTDNGESSTAPEGTDAVAISNFAFAPKDITVKAGTTVTWTNEDDVEHNVVDANNNPDGPKSKLLAKGEAYSFTFTKAGTYDYTCTPHPYMKGSVTVVE